VQLPSRRPRPVPFLPPTAPARWVLAAGRAVLALLALCVVCWHWSPIADARDHRLGPGPSAGAYPLAQEHGPRLDDAGFVARQGTSYAAWYLNAHGVPFGLLTRGPGGPGLFTSAGGWDDAAAAAGFAVRPVPAVGSIAQWEPGEASPATPSGTAGYEPLTAGRYGHVGVVRYVYPDGAAVVAEYDGGDGDFHVLVTRAPRYLYIGLPGDAARLSVLAGAAPSAPAR